MADTWHYVHDLAINEDATVVVHANWHKHIWVRRFPSGELLAEHDVVHRSGMALSRDGSRLATAAWGADPTRAPAGAGVWCYDVITGRPLWNRRDLREPSDLRAGPGPDLLSVCRYRGGGAHLRWSDGSTSHRIRGAQNLSFPEQSDAERRGAYFAWSSRGATRRLPDGSRVRCSDQSAEYRTAADRKLWRAVLPGPPPLGDPPHRESEEELAALRAMKSHDPYVFAVCWPPGLVVLSEMPGDVWALDEHGKVAWVFSPPEDNGVVRCMAYDADRRQILAASTDCLRSLDPATGWENWRVPLPRRAGIHFTASARRGSLLVGAEYFFDGATREITRYAEIYEASVWTRPVSMPWYTHIRAPTDAELADAPPPPPGGYDGPSPRKPPPG